MKLTVLVASLTLMTVNAFAVAPLDATYTFDCGKSMNVARTFVVYPKAPGNDGLSLGGTFVTSGADKVTGMLTAIKTDLVGQTDLSSELTKEETAVITMMDVKNPFHQVIAVLPSRVGQSVKAAEINVKTGEAQAFKCKLISKQ